MIRIRMMYGYAVAFGLALLLAADPSMALFSRTADGARRYFAGNKTRAQEPTVRMVQSFDTIRLGLMSGSHRVWDSKCHLSS